MRLTLKSKFIVSILTVIFVFGFLAVISVFYYTKGVMVENGKRNLTLIAREKSSEIEQIMNSGVRLVETAASQKVFKDYLGSSKIKFQDENVLEHLQHYNIGEFYSAIYIIMPNGVTAVSTDPSFVGKNYGFRDYFKESISNNNYTDVALGVTSKKLGYYFSHSIKNDNNEVIGVVVAKMKPEVLNIVLPELRDFHIMMVDNYGVVIFSDKEDRLLKSLGELSVEQKVKIAEKKIYSGVDIAQLQYSIVSDKINGMISDLEIIEFFDKEDEEDEFLSISKLDKFPFFIVLEEHASSYVAPALSVASLLAVFVFFAALFAALSIIYLISKYLKPLKELQEAAKRVSVGDFSTVVDITKGGLEVRQLSKAFNSMVSNVKKSRKDIEIKVKKQTKDIKKHNAQMEQQQIAMINILEDIEEEKKETEKVAKDLEKFKLAVNEASDHIIITDAEGVILYANKASENVTGFSNKEVVGKKTGTTKLWGGHMSINFYKKLWKTIKEDKKTFTGEINNVRKNGQEYIAFASISPILDNNREVKFFVGIERDITKEKEIDKAKTEFVSLASHQLRTPLSTIGWYVEMLLSGDAGKLKVEQKNYLEEVYRGNKRMVELVNALLNVSRIELGTFRVNPKKINIVEIVEASINELMLRIKKKKLKLTKTCDEKLPMMNADPKLLSIVFDNLMSNAVKYTPEKGKVTVLINKKGNNIKISIIDTGMGIPRAQHHNIFTKLFRADNVRKADTEGTGLGLYIVKSIVENSGGKISFKSEENKGTTFTVILPLHGMKKKEGTKELS